VLFRSVLSETRPMDNMKLHFDLPQEDELATSMLLGGRFSPYMSLYFMRDETMYRQYQCFRPTGNDERQHLVEDTKRWVHAFTYLLQKLKARDIIAQMKRRWRERTKGDTPNTDSSIPKPRRLLLKSPCHTGRVRLLIRLFPNAKFVYVHRHPIEVFLSSAHMASTTYGYMFLQRPTDAQLQEYILRQGELLWGEYEACFQDGLLNEKVGIIVCYFPLLQLVHHPPP
jgi:hypothetical protein